MISEPIFAIQRSIGPKKDELGTWCLRVGVNRVASNFHFSPPHSKVQIPIPQRQQQQSHPQTIHYRDITCSLRAHPSSQPQRSPQAHHTSFHKELLHPHFIRLCACVDAHIYAMNKSSPVHSSPTQPSCELQAHPSLRDCTFSRVFSCHCIDNTSSSMARMRSTSPLMV